MSDKNLTPGEVRELGEATWLMAQEYASKNGLGVTKNGTSGNLVTVNGGVSKFIKEAARQIELYAYVANDKGSENRRIVREFLKEGFNVVVIGKGDGRYDWRLFVSDEWNSKGTVPQHPTILSRKVKQDIDRLSEGESGPVTTSSLWEDFQSNPIGEKQAEILRWLFENGGSHVDENGFMLNRATGIETSKHNSLSDSFVSLMNRGLVKRRMKNARRWSAIALTDRGWWAAERLSYVQTSDIALAAFLHKVGSFTGSTPVETVNELSVRIHKDVSTTGTAIRALADAGLVKAERDTDTGPYRKVTWIGGDDLPGIHITPRIKAMTADAHDAGTTSPPAAPAPEPQPVAPEPVRARENVTTSDVMGPLTDAYAKQVVEQIIAAAKGPDPEIFAAMKSALAKIHGMCKDVESGSMSALRAIVEIEEIARREIA